MYCIPSQNLLGCMGMDVQHLTKPNMSLAGHAHSSCEPTQHGQNLQPRPPRAQDVFADCTWTPRAAVGDPQTHSDHRGQGRAGVPPKFQNLRSKLKLRPVIANAVHTRSRTRHTTQTWRPVTKSAQRLIQDLPCQATELEQESRQAVLGSHGHGHHGIAVQ